MRRSHDVPLCDAHHQQLIARAQDRAFCAGIALKHLHVVISCAVRPAARVTARCSIVTTSPLCAVANQNNYMLSLELVFVPMVAMPKALY
jgi:hypothetical protein